MIMPWATELCRRHARSIGPKPYCVETLVGYRSSCATYKGGALPYPDREPTHYTRNQELRSFLFLTVVMAPALTGAIIAGYGFMVWIFQLISGPPTGG